MPITQAFCDSFKRDLLAMTPHQPGDAYKIALYTARARLGPSTTVYTSEHEVPDSGDYVAGGQVLSGIVAGLDGSVGYLDWTADPRWTAATIAAAGALIYNSSKGNRALAVLDFGGVISCVNGHFDVTLPAPQAASALIRIG
ncbi:MAG TPA: hypothetical protein VM243_07365 [Phycisphaerae bacterium]|nr:hypothetical protein [Phycisphaerae bacterium]